MKNYISFDIETTGLSCEADEIIEIGALKVRDGKVVDRFIEFIKPTSHISPAITRITGISDEMVADARSIESVIGDFVTFCEDDVLVGHNIMFDYAFCKRYANLYGYSFEKKGIDTLKIARQVHKELESKSLGALCEHYQIVNQSAHRAYHDALATAKIYQSMSHYFKTKAPKLFEPQQLMYKPKKIQPMTKKQKDYLCLLCAHHNLTLDKDLDSLTRSDASKLIDSIISTRGRII